MYGINDDEQSGVGKREEGGARKVTTHLKNICKINEHDSAWLHLSASTVQANSNNHIHTTTLNEIGCSGELHDLHSTGDTVIRNDAFPILSDLGSHLLHHSLFYFKLVLGIL